MVLTGLTRFNRIRMKSLVENWIALRWNFTGSIEPGKILLNPVNPVEGNRHDR